MIALLWVVSVNHCAFESLFSNSKVAQTDCTSHSKNGPDSHAEGQPCAVKALSAQQQTDLVPVHLYSVLVSNIFPYKLPAQLNIFQLYDPNPTGVGWVLLNPLISLSIASNAPPVIPIA